MHTIGLCAWRESEKQIYSVCMQRAVASYSSKFSAWMVVLSSCWLCIRTYSQGGFGPCYGCAFVSYLRTYRPKQYVSLPVELGREVGGEERLKEAKELGQNILQQRYREQHDYKVYIRTYVRVLRVLSNKTAVTLFTAGKELRRLGRHIRSQAVLQSYAYMDLEARGMQEDGK